MNLFFEGVVLLYLLDNETSKMILFGCFSTIGVTLWKIYSTSDITRREDGRFPFFKINYQSEYESETVKYDNYA